MTNSFGPRILLLARVFPPRVGGIENLMYSVYSRLASSCDVTVITPTWPGASSFDMRVPFRIVRTPVLPIARERYETPLAGMMTSAISELLRRCPDQIHCDQIHTAVAGRALSSLKGLPTIVWAHGMEVTDNQRLALKRWAARGADRVVVNSRDTMCRVMTNWCVPPERMRLVHPGVDAARFHPAVGSLEIRARYGLQGKAVILTVGRLASDGRHKGHDAVIQCMPTILSQVPDAYYLIVGDGPDRGRLERLARETAVGNRVLFAGAVDDAHLPEYYAACDLFVMASREGKSTTGGVRTEGFGMVFMEASSSGKPVVGTRIGGIPDAIVDGETGVLVEPHDDATLAQAIIAVLRDRDLATRYGLAGRQRVEKMFKWDVVALKVRNIVDEIRR